MRLGKLWRHRWRILGWSTLVLAIAAATAGLHAMVPPEPRWVMEVGPMAVFQVADGYFATFPSNKGVANGPLNLWDAATGLEVQEFLTGTEPFLDSFHSEDGRVFVALIKGDKPGTTRIRGVDLEARREWHADVPFGPFASAILAPNGKLVALRSAPAGDKDNEGRHAVIDTASGRRIAEVPGNPNQVHFSENAGCVVAAYHDEDDNDWIRVVNTATGLVTEIVDARFIAVSSDSRWLIGDRGEEGVWLWDVEHGRWHAVLEGAVAPPAAGRFHLNGTLWADMDVSYSMLVTAYSRFYTHRAGKRAYGLRVYTNGMRNLRSFATLVDPIGSFDDGRRFTPDSRSILWAANPGSGQVQWTFYDVQTGKARWQRSLDGAAAGPQFTPDSRQIVRVAPGGSQVEIVDAATGDTVRSLSLDDIANTSVEIMRQGRRLVVTGMPREEEPSWLMAKLEEWLLPPRDAAPTMFRVYDLNTGTVVNEAWVDESDQHWLTDDARTLVTVTSENNDDGVTATTILGWDVPPTKPVRWVHGLPLGCGLMLVSLVFAWGHVRRRRSPKQNDGAPAGLNPVQ
jgi:hypothetical protein